jgi:hypothetical protein
MTGSTSDSRSVPRDGAECRRSAAHAAQESAIASGLEQASYEGLQAAETCLGLILIVPLFIGGTEHASCRARFKRLPRGREVRRENRQLKIQISGPSHDDLAPGVDDEALS